MTNTKLPLFFWIIVVVAILWNLMGFGAFLADIFTSEEAMALMPEAEREARENLPIWLAVAWGIATVTGLIASIGLALKKAWTNLFIISLVVVVLQMGYFMFFMDLESSQYILPIVVIVIAALLVIYSIHGKKKEWLN